jgi:hypothetical protein
MKLIPMIELNSTNRANTLITPNSHQMSLIQSILYLGGWIAGLWGPFHYFLRTRFYFVGSTTFDYIFFLACLLITFISILIFKNHPKGLFLSGIIGVEIGAFSAIFTTPIMEDANQTLHIVLLEGIETQMGHISGCIIIGSAFLLLGGMISLIVQNLNTEISKIAENSENAENSEKLVDYRVKKVFYDICLPFVLSAISYYGLSFLFPLNSHMPFHIMALVCVIILLLYVYYQLKESTQIPSKTAIKKTIKKEKMTQDGIIHGILRSIGSFLIWIVYTLLIVLLNVFYFHFAESDREILTALNFIISIGIGGGFLIIWIFCTKKFPILQKGIAIVVVIICALVYYPWILTESSPSLNILYGIAGTFIIWYFLKHYLDSPSPLGSIGLLFSWVGNAFVAYIPMDTPALLEFQSWLHWVLIGLVVIILFSEFLVSILSVSPKIEQKEIKEVVTNDHE